MIACSSLRGSLGWCVLFGIAGPASAHALAQARTVAKPASVSIVLLSDLHFDPFHDPAKVAQLGKAPVDQWEGILRSPETPTQAADFAAVQKACKAKQAMDSPYALFRGALQEARAQAPGARFVAVSGDLLVHEFDCRYRASMKLDKAKDDDQSVSAAFAEKTTTFVMKQVESVFPGMPVYLALGNNDSRCNHNRMDLGDAYLKATGPAVIDGLVGISPAERKLALTSYDSGGYYAVTMAAPMEHTRLLVLDDIFMMAKFANCEADDKDQKGAQEQIAWLNRELDAARQRGERVWVLGHVPPAVNPKGKRDAVCAGDVEAYLASDDLANVLISHADVVRLALFGHTHMDELHLLGTKSAGVPMKVIPSVSGVDGNLPSVILGKVDPASATLTDYTVYEASNWTGIGTTWAKEYDFDATYHEPDFSAKSLGDLIGRLHADSAGTTAESQAYDLHYLKGSPSELASSWAPYVCSLDHPGASGFKACACAGK
jgi:sphingomyelin phosphodiesterase acid-like 3